MKMHPEIQRRAHEELDNVVGRDRLPDFADRDRLPYVSCIVKESLRWKAVAPMGKPLKRRPSHLFASLTYLFQECLMQQWLTMSIAGGISLKQLWYLQTSRQYIYLHSVSIWALQRLILITAPCCTMKLYTLNLTSSILTAFYRSATHHLLLTLRVSPSVLEEGSCHAISSCRLLNISIVGYALAGSSLTILSTLQSRVFFILSNSPHRQISSSRNERLLGLRGWSGMSSECCALQTR